MKIKTKACSYNDVTAIQRQEHIKPGHQSIFFRKLMYILSKGELKQISFSCEKIGMEKLGAKEPALFLMNHSSFTDLQIVATLLGNREYHIVCTNDGFIGKEKMMRALGCIPTRKFQTDINLVRDMIHTVKQLKSSIVMYPEASYSFDGSQTPLPESLGKCLKMLGVPVVMIRTRGAFLRDPLYNNLQKRQVKVSAKMTYLLSKEDIKEKSVEELNEILAKAFEYDHFREQVEDKVEVNENFRTDGLHRVLYKCPNCNMEGSMKGEGVSISCLNCNETHILTPQGKLAREDKKEARFQYVTDWYRWERECVRKELEQNQYKMELEVAIKILADLSCIYEVGNGHLVHDNNGFRLTGCDGALDCVQSPKSAYGLYADYFWYEIGDMIAIGDDKYQYYCFPLQQDKAIVAKARLATEEIYKMSRMRGNK